MALTSPDNIWTPDSSDNYALTTDLAATADSIQEVFSSAARTVKVANISARNAALADHGTPSTGNPLIVFRADAGAGREIEYTTDGTVWRTVLAEEDTGWVNISIPSGYSAVPVAQVRRRPDGQVQLRGRIDKNSGNFVGNDSIGFLPEGFRPDILDRYDLSGASGSRVQATILTDGEIRILNPIPPATSGLVFLGGIVLS